MPNTKFVVQFNDTVDLYMIDYQPEYKACSWGTIEHPNVMTWGTLEAAQAVALSINHGTVGIPKPPKP